MCGSRRSDRSEDTTTIKVYTNQPVVSLYNNGELIEQKSGNHIFTFQLPMEKENKIEAEMCIRDRGLSDPAGERAVTFFQL